MEINPEVWELMFFLTFPDVFTDRNTQPVRLFCVISDAEHGE